MKKENNSLLESKPDVVDVDRSVVKIIIVVLFGIISAVLTGLFFEKGEYIFSLISALAFLVVFIIQNIFIKSFDKIFIADFLQVAALSAMFYKLFSGYLLAAIIVLIILLFKASFDAKRELNSTLKIRFFRISKLILGSAAPAVFIFLVAIFLIQGVSIKESWLDRAFYPVTPFVKQYLPDFSPQMPVSELLKDMALSGLQESDVEKINELPKWAANQMIEESIAQLEERMEALTGSDIVPENSVSSNVYSIISDKIAGLSSASRLYLGVIVIVTAFIFIKSLMPIIYPVIAFAAFIIYEILLAVKFAVVQLETRSKEVVILD
jgi:hypothetical protein